MTAATPLHERTATHGRIAGVTGLSSSRIHQLLNAPEAKEIPVLAEPTATIERRLRSKERS